jgi:signal recognition particle subunit SRP68
MGDIEDSEVINSEVEEVIEKPFLSMNVLEIITEERNMHGLRHQDYQRYRRYCTQKNSQFKKILKTYTRKKKISKERNYC